MSANLDGASTKQRRNVAVCCAKNVDVSVVAAHCKVCDVAFASMRLLLLKIKQSDDVLLTLLQNEQT